MPRKILFIALWLGLYGPFLSAVAAQVGSATAQPYITPNCDIDLDAFVTHPSCPGSDDGHIELQINDGPNPSPVVTFEWLNVVDQPNTGSSISNLEQGNYIVELTDENNCMDTLSFQLMDPAQIDVLRNNATLCADQNATTLLLSTQGGTPPYSYSWTSNAGLSCLNCPNTNVVVQQTDVFNVQIQDANGCSINETVFINVLAPLDLTVSEQSETCGNDGQIVAQVSGGASGYSFSLNNQEFQTSNVFDGLASGQYNVYVLDDQGCTEVQAAYVPLAAVEVDVTPMITNILCNGDATGAIDIVDNNGTVASVALNNPDFISPTGVFENLEAGVYSIFVEDVNGCVTQQSVQIFEPPILELNTTGQNTTCPEGNDGQIEALVSGGSMGYQFSLNDGVFQSDSIFLGLEAGIYEVAVQDANGCIEFSNIVVEDPSSPNINLLKEDVTCPDGTDASIVVIVSGGVTTSYQFAINNGSFQPSNTFDGLAAGVYEISVQSSNGCLFTENIAVQEPPEPIIQVNKQDVTCPGGNDASIVVIVSGGATNSTYGYSLDGLEFQAQNDFGGLSAGSYTLTIQNEEGCQTQQNFLIQEPSVPDLIFSQSAVTCPQDSDGSVSIVLSTGELAGYQFSIDGANFQTDNNFFGLEAGIYQAFAQNSSGCVTMENFIIDSPEIPNLQINTQDASCPGEADAAIVVIVSGGAIEDTYEYSLNGVDFQVNADFSGLAAGSYTAIIQNQAGCLTSQNFLVNEPSIPNIQLIENDVTCPGGNNASIVVIVSGGASSEYQYSLDGFSYQTSNLFNGLSAGPYFVSVQDSTGCTFSQTAFLNEPEEPNINFNISSPTCPGENNAAIVVIVSGGVTTDSYEYSLNGNQYQADNNFAGLSHGSYTAFIQNQNGCVSTESFLIVDPPVPDLDFIIEEVSCPGEADASIVVIVSGGISNSYEYSLDGITYQASNTFIGLEAGIYTAFARDDSGCTVAENLVVDSPEEPEITLNVNGNSCPGDNNASIVVIVSGGVTGDTYEYSIDGQIYQQSNTFSGLQAGIYTAFVRSQGGCVTTESIVIQDPSIPNISLDITEPTCPGGNDARIVVIVSGGAAPPYEYSLDDLTYQPSNTFTGLSAGVYTVYSRNSSGCIFPVAAPINEPPAPEIEIQASQVTCPGGNDANIVVIVSGGISSDIYEYSLDGSGFQASNSFTGLQAGNYFAFARNQNGCIFNQNFSITEPPVPNINLTISSVSCPGASDGSITIAVSGGNSPSYTYSIDGSNYQAANIFSSLEGGFYTVYVMDIAGCLFTAPAFIDEDTPASLNYEIIDISCSGDSDGALLVQISGGTGPYEFSIDGSSYQQSNLFSNLSAGSYPVYARDFNACVYSGSAFISEPPPFEVDFTIQNATCGNSSGLAVCIASGASPPYNYLWNTGGTSPIASGLAAGYYTLTITDIQFCTWVDSIFIMNEDGPDATETITNVSCFGFADGAIELEMISGTPPFTFSWSSGGTTEDIFGYPPGNYKVTILDANMCFNILEYVIEGPTPIIIDGEVSASQGEGNIDLTVNGGSGPYDFLWSNGMQTEDISGLSEGTYVVTVTDFHGCEESAAFDIVITGIDPPGPGIEIDVYPNPVSDFIRIHSNIPGNEGAQATVYSITGQLLLPPIEIPSGPSEVKIKVSHFASGVYLVRVLAGNDQVVRKILVE